jgi:D-alanyl-D-alanine carboxypeptidase/D-alanyl-D-alanine-endopeptidase (penicillin-binding protein 4)
VLGELGLQAGEDGLVDGSGLSYNDRISPALLTATLALAARADRPQLRGVYTGLPVAGYSGTLQNRFRTAAAGASAAGMVRAKTGTLTGISAIAGIVVDADGRVLAFAVVADATGPGTGAAQEALDRIAAALAGCGCK